jgi:hypothetical protein
MMINLAYYANDMPNKKRTFNALLKQKYVVIIS